MIGQSTYVAVVDDDESFSRALGRLLRAYGFEPLFYESAEAFMQDTSQPSVECLVLDVHLGGMSGLELLQRLSALGRTTPAIFVTAHDEPEVRQKAEQVGCAAFFRKPVPGRLLVEAITNAIRIKHGPAKEHDE